MYKPTSKRRKILTINFAFALSNLEILIGSAKEHSTLVKLRFSLWKVSQEPVEYKAQFDASFQATIGEDQKLLSPALYPNNLFEWQRRWLLFIWYNHFLLRTQNILYRSSTKMDDDNRWRQSWMQKS